MEDPEKILDLINKAATQDHDRTVAVLRDNQIQMDATLGTVDAHLLTKAAVRLILEPDPTVSGKVLQS